MHLTTEVKNILRNYQSESPAVKSNIARILMSGKLSGTGKMVILPVDQGFEHGPVKSFDINPASYDPMYHVKLAIDAGLNAYAAPKGMLEAISDEYRGCIPLIIKANSSNSLMSNHTEPDQSITANIQDALYLGCTAIGFTIYPGSNNSIAIIEEITEMISEAKSYGLAVVIWSYPRGGDLKKEDETSLDVIAYSAHIAALMGANIIKVKVPSSNVSNKDFCAKNKYDFTDLKNRIQFVMSSSFNSKRLVVFSGGNTKKEDDLFDEIKSIHKGGGNGSIIGRNTFQRPYDEALIMLDKILSIYKS
ncbi:MAG: class I fructose-bisphosphate aldolase [Candidatus Midichloriaceae bacterium]|jgi:class I fructose-bisphosphate aldolase